MNQETFHDDDFYAPQVAAGGNGSGLAAAPVNLNANSMTAIEQSRAVAEVQAALVIAKSQPRSEIQAEHKILEACKRLSLAETAIYSYKRGTEQVEGPSIRLAETMARYWGNLNYGFREVSRDAGSSEIEAYAWDLETNTKAVRQFQMKHVRERRQGDKVLTGERDIYELMANFAQRRVRACILEIIPGDIVETAMAQCQKTLKGTSDKPLKDRIKDMIVHFENLGITEAMIAAKVQHSVDSITFVEYRSLGKLYNSIKDGYATVEEVFGTAAQASTPPPAQTETKKASPGDDKADDQSEPQKPSTTQAAKSSATAKKTETIDYLSAECWDICNRKGLNLSEALGMIYPGVKKEDLTLEQWQDFRKSFTD